MTASSPSWRKEMNALFIFLSASDSDVRVRKLQLIFYDFYGECQNFSSSRHFPHMYMRLAENKCQYVCAYVRFCQHPCKDQWKVLKLRISVLKAEIKEINQTMLVTLLSHQCLARVYTPLWCCSISTTWRSDNKLSRRECFEEWIEDVACPDW